MLEPAVTGAIISTVGNIIGGTCIVGCCLPEYKSYQENKKSENELIQDSNQFNIDLEDKIKELQKIVEDEREQKHGMSLLTRIPKSHQKKFEERRDSYLSKKEEIIGYAGKAPQPPRPSKISDREIDENVTYNDIYEGSCCVKRDFPSNKFEDQWQIQQKNSNKFKYIAEYHEQNDFDFSQVVVLSNKQGYLQNKSLDAQIKKIKERLIEERDNYKIIAGKSSQTQSGFKKANLENTGNVEFYKTNFIETLDTYLLLLTDNNKYSEANKILGSIFNKSKPILEVKELPTYMLNRIESYALRCQANDIDFPFDANMRKIRKYKPNSREDNFNNISNFSVNMLNKAIDKNTDSNNSLAVSHYLKSVIYTRKAEINNRKDQNRNYDNLMEASYHAEQAVMYSPQEAAFHLRKANSANSLGQNQEAMKYVNDSLELAPDYPLAKIFKAKLFCQAGKYKLAKKQFSDLSELFMAPINIKIEKLERNFRGNNIYTNLIHSTIAVVLENLPDKTFLDQENAKKHREFANYFDRKTGVTSSVKITEFQSQNNILPSEERSYARA